MASILAPPLVYSFASRLSVALPGMDWEYVRAPEDAPRLVVFVVLGAVVAALRLGAPLAALIATVRTLMLRRWRRVRQHA